MLQRSRKWSLRGICSSGGCEGVSPADTRRYRHRKECSSRAPGIETPIGA